MSDVLKHKTGSYLLSAVATFIVIRRNAVVWWSRYGEVSVMRGARRY